MHQTPGLTPPTGRRVPPSGLGGRGGRSHGHRPEADEDVALRIEHIGSTAGRPCRPRESLTSRPAWSTSLGPDGPTMTHVGYSDSGGPSRVGPRSARVGGQARRVGEAAVAAARTPEWRRQPPCPAGRRAQRAPGPPVLRLAPLAPRAGLGVRSVQAVPGCTGPRHRCRRRRLGPRCRSGRGRHPAPGRNVRLGALGGDPARARSAPPWAPTACPAPGLRPPGSGPRPQALARRPQPSAAASARKASVKGLARSFLPLNASW
jgi:hypothetical protein